MCQELNIDSKVKFFNLRKVPSQSTRRVLINTQRTWNSWFPTKLLLRCMSRWWNKTLSSITTYLMLAVTIISYHLSYDLNLCICVSWYCGIHRVWEPQEMSRIKPNAHLRVSEIKFLHFFKKNVTSLKGYSLEFITSNVIPVQYSKKSRDCS